MRYKNFLYFFAVIFLLIFQISFLDNFNLFLFDFNLVLVVLVLIVAIRDFKYALIFLLLAGIVMDIYSSLPFGIFIATLFLTAIILELLFLNFFTNRSFYSLVFMGLIAVISYHLFFLSISGFLYLINLSDFFVGRGDWFNFIWELAMTTIVLSICFWFINKLSKLFKPIFLRP